MKKKKNSASNEKITPCHDMVLQHSLILKESKIPRVSRKSLAFSTPTVSFSNSKVARPKCSYRQQSFYMNTRKALDSIISKKSASYTPIDNPTKKLDSHTQSPIGRREFNGSATHSNYNETFSNSSSILKHNDSCASSLSSYIEGASKNFKNIVPSLSISSSSPVLCRKKYSPSIIENNFYLTSHVEQCNYIKKSETNKELKMSQSQVARNSKDSTRTSSRNSIFEPLLSDNMEELLSSENSTVSENSITCQKKKKIVNSPKNILNSYSPFEKVSKIENINKNLKVFMFARTDLGILFQIQPKQCNSICVVVCKMVMKLSVWFVILLFISLFMLLCLLEWFINPLDQMLI
jgi:hypothetical protein